MKGVHNTMVNWSSNESEQEQEAFKKEKALEDQKKHVYKMLQVAAERIATNNYHAQWRKFIKVPYSKKRPFKFQVSEAQMRVVQAMEDVMTGKITPEEGAALLHDPDIFYEKIYNPQLEDSYVDIAKRNSGYLD